MVVHVSDFSWDDKNTGKHDRYVRVRVTDWTYKISTRSEPGFLFSGFVEKTNCKGLNGLLAGGQITNDERSESQPKSVGDFYIVDEINKGSS